MKYYYVHLWQKPQNGLHFPRFLRLNIGCGSRSRQEFTKSSLGILAAYKRRERAMTLVKDLEIISTLQKTDARYAN